MTSAAPKCLGGVLVLINSNNRGRRGYLAITQDPDQLSVAGAMT